MTTLLCRVRCACCNKYTCNLHCRYFLRANKHWFVSFFIFFVNPFAAEPPITARADPYPQLVCSVLSELWENPGNEVATSLLPLVTSSVLMALDNFVIQLLKSEEIFHTIREWAWFGQVDQRESSLTSRLRDSWVRWIEKAWTPFFFPFPAPPTFLVPFTFASSPLSERLEKAREKCRQPCNVDPKIPMKILFHYPPTSPFTLS